MQKQVRDLMFPLKEYAVVSETDTLFEALMKLDLAQQKLAPGRHRHRAVLVADATGRIVGKIGHLGFLKALEPKYSSVGNLGVLSRAGMNGVFLQSMMDFHQLFKEDLGSLCKRAKERGVKEVMHPVEEHIAEDAALSEALHRFIIWQSLSLLVTRGDEVVGLLRLSDVFQYMFDRMMHEC
jgi:CBS domain-containing protein